MTMRIAEECIDWDDEDLDEQEFCDEADEITFMYSSQDETKCPAVTLYHHNVDGVITAYITESDEDDCREWYRLAKVPRDSQAFIRKRAEEIVRDTDRDGLEAYRWKLRSPSEDVVSPDFRKKVRIVQVRNCDDYNPVDWLEYESDIIKFPNYASAKAIVDKLNSQPFTPEHEDEVRRPDFFIVAA